MNDEASIPFIVHRSSFYGRSLLSAGDGVPHHLLVDRDHALRVGCRIELEVADHPTIGLVQRAGAETLLARGVPGDGDERAARDLQIDTESFEVLARGAEDRRLRLDENARQIALAQIVEHHDRLEA